MFYDNLKTLCEKRKLNVSSVMTLAGFKPANATQWKKRGTTPNGETVKRLADVLNCTSEDLLSGEIKAEAGFPDGAIPIVCRTYKVLGNIACGEPVTPDQTQEVLVSPYLPEADFILRANGDSMTGDRIHDGDLIFIRQQETVDNGQIAAVLIDGETTLKHFYLPPLCPLLTDTPGQGASQSRGDKKVCPNFAPSFARKKMFWKTLLLLYLYDYDTLNSNNIKRHLPWDEKKRKNILQEA